jgi:high-affinity iron transporter
MSLVRRTTVPIAGAVVVLLLCSPGLAEQKPATGTSAGKTIYDRDCATCHGEAGKGDGETAAYLTPQPQDFTNGVIQKRSDEFLTTVIAKGGAAKGLAESMPGFPKLSKTDVQSVVAYVRQLAKDGAKKPK